MSSKVNLMMYYILLCSKLPYKFFNKLKTPFNVVFSIFFKILRKFKYILFRSKVIKVLWVNFSRIIHLVIKIILITFFPNSSSSIIQKTIEKYNIILPWSPRKKQFLNLPDNIELSAESYITDSFVEIPDSLNKELLILHINQTLKPLIK